MSEFDSHRFTGSLKQTVRWLAFLRGLCIVRSPACVMSRYETVLSYPTKKDRKTWFVLPVPDMIVDLLGEAICEYETFQRATGIHPIVDPLTASKFLMAPKLVDVVTRQFKRQVIHHRRVDRAYVDKALCTAMIELSANVDGLLPIMPFEIKMIERFGRYFGPLHGPAEEIILLEEL